MFKRITSHLKNNAGSEYVEKLVLIVIAFVVGGLLLTIFKGAFTSDTFKSGIENAIQQIFSW